jgi:ferredoxin
MTIRVDPTKCSGIGMCEMTAPDVFEIGDDGQAHVLNDAPDGDTAHDAMSNCPTGAISIGD